MSLLELEEGQQAVANELDGAGTGHMHHLEAEEQLNGVAIATMQRVQRAEKGRN
jgi:hypothetical protein